MHTPGVQQGSSVASEQNSKTSEQNSIALEQLLSP